MRAQAVDAHGTLLTEFEGRLDSALARHTDQQPGWPDPRAVGQIRDRLAGAPPVVQPSEVDALTARLAQVARGDAFLLQGGDCAETFADNTDAHVGATVQTLRAMADRISAAGRPVVVLARVAGQYAKPRSCAVDASGLPAYRGDMVNSSTPEPAARAPDPARLIRGYVNSVMAMRRVREFAEAGGDDVYSSHEALLLDYERAMARPGPPDGPHLPDGPRLYGLSGHLLWIGDRTRRLDGAHIAFAELIANPIEIKFGPAVTAEQAVQYVERLNPDDIAGRLTLVSRMGHRRVRDLLPPLVEKVAAAGRRVIWQCDPMHGNTYTATTGQKVRHFDHIVDEVTGFFEVLRSHGVHPGGLHLELAGEDVTECLGGKHNLGEADLTRRYTTSCDPRLNQDQAMELAQVVTELS